MSHLRQATVHIFAIGAFAVTATVGLAGPPKDIVQTAASAGSFGTLIKAAKAAGLADALSQDGPFTVFAPTDAAFAELPQSTLQSLLRPESRDLLRAILTYHVVPTRLTAADVAGLDSAKTLNGQQINIRVNEPGVMVDSSHVIKADIICSNGVIHVIDGVLMPSTEDIVAVASSAGNFNTLLAAAQAAGLAEALSGAGPLTVFAPTDEAFSKLPESSVKELLQPRNRERLAAILKYHVVAGRVFATDAITARSAKTLQGQPLRVGLKNGRLRVNNATVIANDLDAANGVIHVIDTVLMPSGLVAVPVLAPAQLIEVAIERGAPQYNNGNPSACAAIYEITIRSLLANSSAGLPEPTKRQLSRALERMTSEHDAAQQAWILRHALDDAYRSLASNEG